MTSTDPVTPTTPTTSPTPSKVDPEPGEGRRARSGHVTSYGGGRVCSLVGCTTVLSIYNAGSSCSGHSIIADAGNQTRSTD